MGVEELPSSAFSTPRPQAQWSGTLKAAIIVALLTLFYLLPPLEVLFAPRSVLLPDRHRVLETAPPRPLDREGVAVDVYAPDHCYPKTQALDPMTFLPPSQRYSNDRSDAHQWLSPTPPLPLDATLASRIEAWLAAPLASSETWEAFNNLTCNHITRKNALPLSHRPRNALVDSKIAAAVRQELTSVLLQAEEEGKLAVSPSLTGKQGIVFVAEDKEALAQITVSLRMIRGYGTKLPAEVFYAPGHGPTASQKAAFEKLDATVRAVTAPRATKARDSTPLKGAALLESAFEQILYLASDTIPVKDVTPVFTSAGYLEHGALLFPDSWKEGADNAIWSIIGTQCRDEWSIDGSQMLINKAHHLDVLVLVDHMMTNYDLWSRFSGADEDLFRYAFLALRKRWAVPGRTRAPLSWLPAEEKKLSRTFDHQDKICGHSTLQHDVDGSALFLNYNLLSQSQGTFSEGTTWGRTHRIRIRYPVAPHNYSLSADHFANANPQGISILNAPLAIRQRAAIERGFWTESFTVTRSKLRMSCIDIKYKDQRVGGDAEYRGQDDKCDNLMDRGWEQRDLKEVLLWEHDTSLIGFEEAFYAAGGKVNDMIR